MNYIWYVEEQNRKSDFLIFKLQAKEGKTPEVEKEHVALQDSIQVRYFYLYRIAKSYALLSKFNNTFKEITNQNETHGCRESIVIKDVLILLFWCSNKFQRFLAYLEKPRDSLDCVILMMWWLIMSVIVSYFLQLTCKRIHIK